MPSRTTLKWLVANILLATLVCLQLFAADYGCGAQSWECATISGIALVSLVAGMGLGLFLTVGVVLLGWGYLLLRPAGSAPESKARSGPVAVNLTVLHLLVFGLMQFLGVLPLGWVWWLGALGAIGMHAPGSVYIFVPPS